MLFQSEAPEGKNEVSTGWIVGTLRSLPEPASGSVVFTLACCEWDWRGGGGNKEMLIVCVLWCHGAYPVSVRTSGDVFARLCCFIAISNNVTLRPVPNPLETLLVVLFRPPRCVWLSFLTLKEIPQTHTVLLPKTTLSKKMCNLKHGDWRTSWDSEHLCVLIGQIRSSTQPLPNCKN